MNKNLIQKTPRSKLVSVLIHILIWLVFGMALLIYQPLTLGLTMPYQFWIKQSIILLLLVGVYYLNARLLVPRFLLKNRNYTFFMLMILMVVIAIFFSIITDQILHMHELMEKALIQKGQHPAKERHYGFEMFMIIITGLVLAISTSITSTQKLQHDLQLRLTLEQEKISSELSFLKAQINPHFFFNTLNNIYALTLINVESSRQALHQLSRMMRYLLYETQQGSTLLSKEIAFIKDYISLMQLRLTELTEIVFEVPDVNPEITMAPMLLLPFIENAFKHGISTTKPSRIFISIKQNQHTLELLVKNPLLKEQQFLSDENKGIGLLNTIRRLDLLYPAKYTLDIKKDDAEQQYCIDLKIKLA